LVLRISAKAAQLVLGITEQHADDRRVERRLALEKQGGIDMVIVKLGGKKK
jgi:hypothetical protein